MTGNHGRGVTLAPGLCADPAGLVWRKTPALAGEGDPGRKQASGCRCVWVFDRDRREILFTLIRNVILKFPKTYLSCLFA